MGYSKGVVGVRDWAIYNNLQGVLAYPSTLVGPFLRFTPKNRFYAG